MLTRRESLPTAGGSNPKDRRTDGNDGGRYTSRDRFLQCRKSAELCQLRRQRYAQRTYPLGDRVEFEPVEKLVDHFGLDTDAVDQILARFAGLDPDALCALGADRLTPWSIHSVGSVR